MPRIGFSRNSASAMPSTISQLMAMSTKAKVTPIDVQTCGERSMSPKASSPTQRAVDQSVPSGQS